MKQVTGNNSTFTPEAEHERPQAKGRFESLRTRLILVAFALGAYVISFILLSKIYGKGGPTAAVLPVAAVGWLFGFVPGVVAAF